MVDIEVRGIDEMQRRFAVVLDATERKNMNKVVGMDAQERIAEHIGKASVSRHKSADKLGAEHSGFLEWAPGRGLLESTSKYKGDGPKPYLKAQAWDEDSVEVVIGNTPGLSRAFQSLTIKPKGGKKWLTIPKSPLSYSLRVADMRTQGWDIYRPFGVGENRPKVLLGKRGGEKPALLYVLCGQATIPRDEGLLPKDERISGWAADAVEEYIESYAEMNS